MGAPRFFLMMSAVAAASGLMLRLVDAPVRRAFDMPGATEAG
jgi:hypothetical protein